MGDRFHGRPAEGAGRLGNRWNDEEAITDPIRLLEKLERQAHRRHRSPNEDVVILEVNTSGSDNASSPSDDSTGMAVDDKTPLLKDAGGGKKKDNSSSKAKVAPAANGGVKEKDTGGAAKKKPAPIQVPATTPADKTTPADNGKGKGKPTASNGPANTSQRSNGTTTTTTTLSVTKPRKPRTDSTGLSPVTEEDSPPATTVDAKDISQGSSKGAAADSGGSTGGGLGGKFNMFSRVRDVVKKIDVPAAAKPSVFSFSSNKLLSNAAAAAVGSKAGPSQSSASASATQPTAKGSKDASGDHPVLQIVSEIVEDKQYRLEKKRAEQAIESSDDERSKQDSGTVSGQGSGLDTKEAAKPPQLSPEELERIQKENEKRSQRGACWEGFANNPDLAVKIMNMSRRGDWLGVDALLKHAERSDIPADLNDETTGMTPLMYAVKDSRVGIADKLLDLGANVNAKSKDGTTALHLASYHVREDMVRLLLNRKADPSVAEKTKGQLPIHVLSARATGAAIVPLQLLLRAGDKNVRILPDNEGNIPLFLAVEAGNHGVCRDLLSTLTKEQVSYIHPKTGNTALHIATRRRDLDIVRFLLECDCPINHQNAEGESPLHIAAREGDEHAVKLFHHYGANPNVIDIEDRTPLHVATAQGHVAVVELLTDKYRASLHQRTKDGSTLMHIAAEAGRPETALVFMKKGVPLHMSNKAGAKCIHTAAQKGFVEVVRTLLQRGENVDVKTNDGHTALHIAVAAGQSLVVETLLGYGAQVQLKAGNNQETPLHTAARTKGGDLSAELLIKSGAAVNERENNGEIPLHFACRGGHLRTTKLLLTDGSIPDCLNKDGESPLHVSVKNCHFEVVQALLDHWDKSCGENEADKSKLANQKNSNGENSLHYAATITEKQKHYPTEDRDIMRLLLSHGGDVNAETKLSMETPIHHCARTGNVVVLQEILNRMSPSLVQISCNQQARNGWAPLLYACDAGHAQVAKLLIQSGARVDMFDETGRASLHLACERGHEELVDILLESKAFVNVRSQKGLTPMHMAAENGFATIVRKLVTKHSAHMDALSLIKRTPLHMAAGMGQLDVCTLLVELGSDCYALDNQGQTPMMLAIENDHSEVVKLFLRKKPDLATMSNAKGWTCAHIAAMKGSVSVIKELMKFNKTIVTSCVNKQTGSTPLHLAAAGGYTRVVRMLVEAGADAKEENNDGDTPLHLAAKNGHVPVARVLNTIVPWTTTSKKTGLTALHLAANHGQMDFVREMLTEVQASIASQPMLEGGNGDYGMTAIHLAAAAGHEAVVRMLLNSPGTNVDAATAQEGMYPLHFAAQGGHLAVASLILSRAERQLQCTDKVGRTPLHVAAAHGKREMVGLLHSQGAEINATDHSGWTALHYAARHGYLSVVKILVENGAVAKVGTKDGKVPLCLAAAEGHYDIISYLLKKDHDTSDLMEDKHFLIDLMVSAKIHQNKPVIDFILASDAPIDTAVKISRSYELLSLKEKERAFELEEMSKFCDTLSNELMSIAASNNNTAALLRALDNRNMPFLDVLIELQRKAVVAHPAVQKYLTELWMGGYTWSSTRVLMLFLAFLFCPVVWVSSSLFCGHRIANAPIVKFMSYLVSHIFFVFFLSLTIINPWHPIYESKDLWPLWNEWFLLFWLFGMFIAEMTNPSDREGLGYIRTVVLFFSMLAIAVHLVAFFMPDLNSRLVCLYIRNQFFGIALLMGFLEFLNFLTFHHLFGPWAVIIRDLIKDLMRFLAILLIFLVGFSLCMCAVYQPVFAPPKGDNITLPMYGSEFQSPFFTFEMLFFSLFGLVEPDYMPPLHLSPSFAKIIVKTVFGVYMMVTVVVLINLLIAMMSDTYQRIQAQSDTEWKFGRAKLIRNMKKASPSPSPINIITVLPELYASKCQGSKATKGFGSTAAVKGEMGSGTTGSRTGSGRANRRVMPLEEMVYGMNKLSTVVDWPAISSKYLDVRRASLSIVEQLQHTSEDKEDSGGKTS